MSQSQQPQLIVTISSGYLVFIGLVVAASATVLASDRASQMPWWARALLLIPLVISAVSGIAALIGANSAHNIGRRAERLDDHTLASHERTKLEKGVQDAREFAGDCIYWSLTGAIVAAVSLFFAMLPFVFLHPQKEASAVKSSCAPAPVVSISSCAPAPATRPARSYVAGRPGS